MNNLRHRDVEAILIAVVDGVKGFPNAINAAFPETTVQTCFVHLVCHSLNFCGWKDRKAVADFEAEWGQKHPSIAPSWQRAWQEVIPFFAFPPAVRKIIHTTNVIGSLNRVIRKNTKNAWQLANRGYRDKADLSRDPLFREGGEMRQRMYCRTKPVRYSIPRTVQ